MRRERGTQARHRRPGAARGDRSTIGPEALGVVRRSAPWRTGRLTALLTALTAALATALAATALPTTALAAGTGLPDCTGSVPMKALALVAAPHHGWDYQGVRVTPATASAPATVQTVWKIGDDGQGSSTGTITVYGLSSPRAVAEDLGSEAYLERMAHGMKVVAHSSALTSAFPLAGATVFEQATTLRTSLAVV